MKRIVLDTNVLVSGTFWTGDSFTILELASQGKLTLVLSSAILSEYQNVVGRSEITKKTGIRHALALEAVRAKLLQNSVWVEPVEKSTMYWKIQKTTRYWMPPWPGMPTASSVRTGTSENWSRTAASKS
ncbi:PIN domain-containing protein [Candidatus Micrarchaeota archaeon]|nr:PIN domain-containing protein [Candidatus Micrarchaeota archaeon]